MPSVMVTSGGINIGDVIDPCSSSRQSSPPVQLDLFPCMMRSSHSSETSACATDPAPSSSATNSFSWQITQLAASRTNSGIAAAAGAGAGYDVDDGEVETYTSSAAAAAPDHVTVVGVSATTTTREYYIDINQLPNSATTSSTDGDGLGAVVGSSPASSIGMNIKTEIRVGKLHHADHDLHQSDRGFGFQSARAAGAAAAGISDDEVEDQYNNGAGYNSSSRKKLRLSKEQSALLEQSFEDHSTLNPKQKTALAKQLHLRPRQVEVWFQNRRARTKLKQTEVDCELLKRCCESLSQENRRLRKEVQEFRALMKQLQVAAPPAAVTAAHVHAPYHVQLAAAARDFSYMQPLLPAATITMCPSCKRVATVAAAAHDTQQQQKRPAHIPAHMSTFPANLPVTNFSHTFLQPSAAC